MKIEIPEKVYFRIMQQANDFEIPVNDYINGLFERFSNLESVFEGITQDEIENFNIVLNNTIQEIMQSQYDLSISDEGTPDDKKMIEVLNILFARATRDRFIINECISKFYDKEI